MKKISKVMACVIVAIMAMFCLTGCANGKYVCKNELLGTLVSTETIELKGGKKCSMTVETDGKSTTTEGTYAVDGENITITLGKNELKGTIKDGVITIGLQKYTK